MTIFIAHYVPERDQKEKPTVHRRGPFQLPNSIRLLDLDVVNVVVAGFEGEFLELLLVLTGAHRFVPDVEDKFLAGRYVGDLEGAIVLRHGKVRMIERQHLRIHESMRAATN